MISNIWMQNYFFILEVVIFTNVLNFLEVKGRCKLLILHAKKEAKIKHLLELICVAYEKLCLISQSIA